MLGFHSRDSDSSQLHWGSGIAKVFFFFFFLINLFYFIYLLFLAALGLRCCTRDFSSCHERGSTLHCGARSSHCGGFSCCRAWALGAQASVVVQHAGLVAPWHVGSSQTRAGTHVPCIGKIGRASCRERV